MKKKVTVETVLKDYPEGLSLEEISEKTGLSKPQVLRKLNALEKKGVVGDTDEKPLEKKEKAPKSIVKEVKKELAKKPKKKKSSKKVKEKPEFETQEEIDSLDRDIDRKPVKEKVVKKKSVKKVRGEFKWSQKMSVGEETIDEQHTKILNQINELIKDANKGFEYKRIRKLLGFLNTYIKEHLSYEEKYMKKIKYPNLNEHKRLHIGFIDSYSKFKEKYERKNLSFAEAKAFLQEVKDFLGDWWMNHISTEDYKYCVFSKKCSSKELEEEPVKRNGSKKVKELKEKQTEVAQKPGKINIAAIKKEVEKELKGGSIEKHEADILKQRAPAAGVLKEEKGKLKKVGGYIKTGVPGFDDLLERGIPQKNNVIVAGGAGSGKTIFCLQTLVNKAKEGKRCLIMSLEEREDRLVKHMNDFGWDVDGLIKKGSLKIMRVNPFEITRNVDALLAKQRGELLIEVNPIILPKDFKNPDYIVIDSLTAIASAFTGKDESYRIYIEQLFRFLENTNATSLLITETEQIPKIFSPTGVEEFLADGVIVMYNFKRGDVRESAIEVLKMRGEKHQKKIVAMTISDNGITVYPEQEVFSDTGE